MNVGVVTIHCVAGLYFSAYGWPRGYSASRRSDAVNTAAIAVFVGAFVDAVSWYGFIPESLSHHTNLVAFAGLVSSLPLYLGAWVWWLAAHEYVAEAEMVGSGVTAAIPAIIAGLPAGRYEHDVAGL